MTLSEVGLGSADCETLRRTRHSVTEQQGNTACDMGFGVASLGATRYPANVTSWNETTPETNLTQQAASHDCVLNFLFARHLPLTHGMRHGEKFKEKKKKRKNDKTENSHASRCSAGLKDDAAGASSVGFLCSEHIYSVYKNTRPRAERIRCLQLGAQDDKVFLFFLYFGKKKTEQQP